MEQLSLLKFQNEQLQHYHKDGVVIDDQTQTDVVDNTVQKDIDTLRTTVSMLQVQLDDAVKRDNESAAEIEEWDRNYTELERAFQEMKSSSRAAVQIGIDTASQTDDCEPELLQLHGSDVQRGND